VVLTNKTRVLFYEKHPNQNYTSNMGKMQGGCL